MKALVIGATGSLGPALRDGLRACGSEVIATSRGGGSALTAFDLAATPDSWQLPAADVAYLLAGITSIDRCEGDPVGTHLVNVERTLALAERLARSGTHIVCVSTNLVLAGDRPDALVTDRIAPQCAYAAQKAEVERALLAFGPAAAILRITKVAEGLDRLLAGWAERLSVRQPIEPFADLICAPMPRADVTSALVTLGIRRLSGLHQIGADADVSYAEIARRLAAAMGADAALVRPTTSAQAGVKLQAKPRHTTLDARASLVALGLSTISTDRTIEALIARVLAGLSR
ncbi:MAG TPA: sugar nucleotide-binding protein [Hyphomicrobiaceae bacterium]|nr:sugar nucleotide-binding protein [Hyphomicrobiaceae bacterium]